MLTVTRLQRTVGVSKSALGGRIQRKHLWAVPFSIDEMKARATFDSWAAGTPRILLQAVRPEYVPFFIFKGQIQGTFTGVLTYRNSLGGNRRETEYARTGLKIEKRDINARTLSVYAGFEHPARYVEEALLTGGAAVPLDAADAPPTTKVGAFAMKPSFAYGLVQERLKTTAQEAALWALRTGQFDRLAFRQRGLLGGDTMWSTMGGDRLWSSDIIPANLWGGHYRSRIEDLKCELYPAGLAERGVVLRPCFVCEYTHDSKPYVCWVNGVNGQLVGMTHPRSDAMINGGGFGLLLALMGGMAAAPVIDDPATLDSVGRGLAALSLLPVVGGLIGRFQTIGYLEEWIMAERFRKLNAERHSRGLKPNNAGSTGLPQVDWEGEVSRVCAGVSASETATRAARIRRKRSRSITLAGRRE